jgi:hypothetical protein
MTILIWCSVESSLSRSDVDLSVVNSWQFEHTNDNKTI